MELTLKRLLEQAEFTEIRKGKAYDRDEVDAFLDRAVAMATKVEAKLTETMARANAAPAANEPGDVEVDVEAEVERRVAARLADAPAAQRPDEEDLAEETRRTLLMAQRTADAAVREAREEAATLLKDASDRAATIQADIDQQADTARAEAEADVDKARREAHERLAGEIAELEGVREALRSDMTVLDRHVEEQRNQVRSTVGELQRLLEDPKGFRTAPMPALLEPEVPDLGPSLARSAAAEQVDEAPSSRPDATPAEEPVAAAPLPPAPAPEPEAAPAPELSFAEVDHAAPGVEPGDTGEPTAQVSAVDLGMEQPEPPVQAPATMGATPVAEENEDAFLAELRKAMADDEPLGPRDHDQHPAPSPEMDEDDDDDKRNWRFGKRR